MEGLSDGEVEAAAAALREGLPVVLPTDTVYGLCANASSDEAIRRAYELKGRDPQQPSALLAGDVDMLLEGLPELQGRIEKVVRSLLPGPLTLVVPNPVKRFPLLTGERADTIGIRVPELPGPTAAVLATGLVMATSANHPGGPDPDRLDEVPDEILEGCGAAIDAGELPGRPSTVIDLTGEEPQVLREGALSAQEALGRLAGLAAE